MSRVVFAIGLIVSAALHLALLRCSTTVPTERAAVEEEAVAASVMETELAERPEPEPVEPQPEPETEEPAPEPEPAPPVEETPPSEPPQETQQPEPSQPPASEPEQEEPTPSQPDLADMAEPEPSTSIDSSGDLAGRAEAPEKPPTPELRIDWGGMGAAIQTLRAGQMKLAILTDDDPRPRITAEVRRDDETWTRQRYQRSGRIRYSNRLRVVDGVPAFRQARRQLNLSPRERLVVLVPTRIERLLESRQLTEAFDRGLELEHVRRFGGRFTHEDSDIDFEITRVQVRSE